MAKKNIKPRKSIRFRPDPFTLAYFSFKPTTPFKADLVALVLNESYTGCSLFFNTENKVKKDQKISIKVGQLAVMQAKIVWIKNLDENLFKVGIKFLD